MTEAHQQSPRLTAIDLFSGAGGMTLGLKRAGFDVIAAVEIEELAAATYRVNHPDTLIWERDIRDIDPSELMEQLELRRGELSVLAGCAPCQGFSTMRTLNGSRQVEEPRNDLVLELLRFAEEMRPNAVLMENVPGLATDVRWAELLHGLDSLGFLVSDATQILNAANYGVPQNRRRLVMMAAVGQTVEAPDPIVGKATVREAISGLPAAGTSGDPLHDHGERRSEEVLRRIVAIPNDGGSRIDLPEDLQLPCHQTTSGFKDVYGRMKWDKPAPTITSGCFNPSKGRFLHPSENRAITLREAALLQSFPPDYFISLKGGKQRAATLIGNALPPMFVEHHARQIAAVLNKEVVAE